MQDKVIGSDIDINQHQKMLLSFSEFIKNFSPLLDDVEMYYQNLVSSKLLDSDEIIEKKISIIEEISTCLTDCIPIFLEFSILENKLDNLNNK